MFHRRFSPKSHTIVPTSILNITNTGTRVVYTHILNSTPTRHTFLREKTLQPSILSRARSRQFLITSLNLTSPITSIIHPGTPQHLTTRVPSPRAALQPINSLSRTTLTSTTNNPLLSSSHSNRITRIHFPRTSSRPQTCSRTRAIWLLLETAVLF